LFVYGPSGVGKTHLLKGILHAFRARGAALRALYVTGEQFFHQYSMSVQDGTSRKFRERYRSLDVLIVDDVQLLVSKRKTQIEFLHTFTWLVESGRQIVLASDVPPKALTELDAGLVGRFLSGLVVGIGKPEFETRLGILRGPAGRIPSRLDDSVLELVAGQVRANVRELIGALMRLDIQAQLRGGALTFQEAREVVAEIGAEACSRIDLRRIRDAVAAHFGLAPEVVVSSSRQRHVTLARQVAMYVARRCTKESLGAIGKYFGRRDHATVQCAAKKIALLVQEKETSVVLHVRAILDSLEA
ncbi:MAG: DnaA ATPase domain-containing protein, partial [Planctomycetota bacterium]